MNTNEFTLVANHRPEVLERVLRVIRHRGYCVTNLQMRLDNEKVWLDFTTTNERDPCLLIPQLQKLHDVIDVTCENCE